MGKELFVTDQETFMGCEYVEKKKGMFETK